MAVNEVRSLLERHGHIVQEIDGANDHGEDLHVPAPSSQGAAQDDEVRDRLPGVGAG
ncbi:hypothetical protein ACQEVM_05620 [Streptomyces sp. CA-243310]|uniref:hypothetical protein n=1 Tax=Streptomyces sp. CA-243310 TaxID=3240056 RepID=UPI003D93CDBE